jgi:hypothetical protein
MRAALALILVLLACGSAPPPSGPSAAPAAVPAAPPLPRSSIAAVLLHRDELGLSDEQVHALQDLDNDLAEANAKIAEGPPRRPAPDAGTASGSVGMRGTGMGRGHGQRHAAPAPAERRGTPVEQRMDDNDTHAFLRAEEILTDAQRDRARDIAEEYREALYDRRHPGEAPR